MPPAHPPPLDLVAEVILDRAVWALDRPLTYRVPRHLQGALEVGSIVRVPLRGRRVRGWVVEVREVSESSEESKDSKESETETLMPVGRISGSAPLFDRALLSALEVMAHRYVRPLAAFLRLVTPPTMGPSAPRGRGRAVAPAPGGGIVSRTLRRLGPREDPLGLYADLIERGLRRGKGSIVVVPEIGDEMALLGRLRDCFAGEAAVVHSGRSPAERAAALWSVARGERRVVLGSRAAVLAPSLPLGAVIVHQEHDRSLKETRAPHYDAREVAVARASAAGASLLLASRTPSVSSWHRAGRGWEVVEPSPAARREGWPVVEAVEPARGGRSGSVLPQRVVAAVLEARRGGEPVLIFMLRARATPAGPGPREVAAYLARALPEARVTAEHPGDVVVSTRVLAGGEDPAVRIAVAVGVDAVLERAAGRAAEEGFATLWGLASGLVRGSRRGRLLVETRDPRHHVIQALTRADYGYFLRRELDVRRRSGSPPFSALIRLRTGSPGGDGNPESVLDPSDDLVEALEALAGTEVLGPVEGRRGMEFLLKVQDREKVLGPLRALVSSRKEGIRVEMDPPDW